MDSSHTNTTLLTNLLVFNNTLQPGMYVTMHLSLDPDSVSLVIFIPSFVFRWKMWFFFFVGWWNFVFCLFISFVGLWITELMRSVHVYRRGGGEKREVEREFVFSESGSYVEMQATPIPGLVKSRVSEVCEGHRNGVWLCVFAFHADHTPQFCRIPRLLLVTRYICLALHLPFTLVHNIYWIGIDPFSLYDYVVSSLFPPRFPHLEWIAFKNREAKFCNVCKLGWYVYILTKS